LTVSETAHDPPAVNDETEEMNQPEKLAKEATMINQNFTQQVLLDGSVDATKRKTYEANPFYSEEIEGEPAAVAYRYRRFTLGDIRLVARCELHGWSMKHGQEQLFTCYALNEWDSKYCGGTNWRQKIDQQKGAVLATELKNNSCKFAKWTAQSILSGADQMKLGYVSRVSPNNPNDHAVLATQFFKPKDIAAQLFMQPNNMWGIVKMMCELVMSKEDGLYVLLKDPNKATVRLYSVPPDAFEIDKDDGEEEKNEGDEENDSDA
jgi:translation initiation factor 3 subunit D